MLRIKSSSFNPLTAFFFCFSNRIFRIIKIKNKVIKRNKAKADYYVYMAAKVFNYLDQNIIFMRHIMRDVLMRTPVAQR